jgi:hypothetical protein
MMDLIFISPSYLCALACTRITAVMAYGVCAHP